MLVTFFEQVRALGPDLLEVVFVSSDEDQAAFDAHFRSMPWAALPYPYRDRQQTLMQRFRVLGLPRLVVLDGTDGTVKDEDAASTVVESLYDVNRALQRWH